MTRTQKKIIERGGSPEGNWWSTQAVTNSPPPHTDRGQYWASIYSNPAQDLVAIRDKQIIWFSHSGVLVCQPPLNTYLSRWTSTGTPLHLTWNSIELGAIQKLCDLGFSLEGFPGWSSLDCEPPPHLKLYWKASWFNSEAFWDELWGFWVGVSWTWAMAKEGTLCFCTFWLRFQWKSYDPKHFMLFMRVASITNVTSIWTLCHNKTFIQLP